MKQMKMKSFMAMMVAAVALVACVCACGSDDDEPEAPLAQQVAGLYTGEEVMTVMGEDTPSTKTYAIAKSSDTSIDMTMRAACRSPRFR